jgi:hypothetical protein
MLSMLAAFAFGAVASAAAQAEGPVWFVKGVELKSGETAKVVSKNTTSYALVGKLAGVTVEIVCTAVADKSTLIGGAPGKDENTIEFTKCTLKLPAESGCKVAEPIVAKTLTNLVFLSRKASTEKWKVQTEKEYEEAPGKKEERAIADEFKPASGETFVTITLSGCNKAHEALDGAFPVKGTDFGITKGKLLEFTKETSNLTFGGSAATLTGTSEQEQEGGGTVEAKQ